MKLLFKNIYSKIKKSIGRFFSLLAIVALGVGFFAGLRETSPNMLSTADEYYDKYNLMDFKIVSTMGLTNDDISSLTKLSNIKKVFPSYSLDVLSNGESIRIHAIEDVNQVKLIEGKMPKNDNECVADSHYYNIGDKITVERDNITDYIKTTEYTVVGTVESVM